MKNFMEHSMKHSSGHGTRSIPCKISWNILLNIPWNKEQGTFPGTLNIEHGTWTWNLEHGMEYGIWNMDYETL